LRFQDEGASHWNPLAVAAHSCLEVALLAWVEARARAQSAHLIGNPHLAGDSGGFHLAFKKGDANQLVLGRSIESFLKSDLSGKLSRYETTLQRQLSGLLKVLRDMQARRKDAAQD